MESRVSARWDAVLGFAEPTERDKALRSLLDGTFGGTGGSVDWLRSVKSVFSPSEALCLQRKALQTNDFHRQTAEPRVIEELIPDLSAAAALLRRPLPKKSLRAAQSFLDAWASSLLPVLRGRLGGLSDSAGRRLDAAKTIRRNLRLYDPHGRRLAVSKLYFRPKRTLLPPYVVILLDRSDSMRESAVWAALCACALYGLPEGGARLFCFAEELSELSALCGDPASLLLSLPTGGGTDLGGALRAIRTQIDTPSRTALFLLSDLRGDAKDSLAAAAALLGEGVDLRLLLPPDRAAYDNHLAERMCTLGASADGFGTLLTR